MGRLARYLFTFCSVISLVVCVAASGGWLASRASGSGAIGRVGTVSDGVGLWLNRDDVALIRETRVRIPAGGTLLPPATQTEPGVVRVSLPGPGPVRPLPYWSLAAGGVVLPSAWAYRARKAASSRRLRGGLCLACGYDLRASPQRCPECGTAAESVSA